MGVAVEAPLKPQAQDGAGHPAPLWVVLSVAGAAAQTPSDTQAALRARRSPAAVEEEEVVRGLVKRGNCC